MNFTTIQDSESRVLFVDFSFNDRKNHNDKSETESTFHSSPFFEISARAYFPSARLPGFTTVDFPIVETPALS